MNWKTTGTLQSSHRNRHLTLAVYALAAMLLTALLLPVRSEAAGTRPSVLYGQTCRGYGGPEGGAKLETAMESLRAYFNERGMEVQMVSHSSHFIRADIYRDGEKIDSIVFDIMTGRMRSVY